MVTQAKAFQVNVEDTVATLIDDMAAVSEVAVLGGYDHESVQGLEAIKAGHKIALVEIAEGEAVVKFGVPIGRARRRIQTGEWVHLHNIESLHDERSGTLDPVTGAASDTIYS